MTARAKRATSWGGFLVAIVVVSVVVAAMIMPTDEERFIKAVQDGDVAAVAAFLNKRNEFARLEQSHKGGTTPVLEIALGRGHNGVVRLLVAHGATPEKYPGVLLHARNIEAAQLLIEHGADINQPGKYGDAALHFFAARDDTSMAEFLISRGADVNVRGARGETPLHRAAREGCLTAARLLVTKGADINAKTKGDKTPLDYAVQPVWNEDAQDMGRDRIRKCREVALYLLSCGSACTIVDLAWLGDIDRLSKRLASDPSLANACANGEPLLFPAIRGGGAETVEYLLTQGAQLGVAGHFQQTPLQVAAYVGHANVAEVLLTHGADADEKGPWGETALHWAAFRGNTDVAALLLDRGADPNVETSGHTVDLNVRSNDVDPIEREILWFQIRERQRRFGGQVAVPPRLAFTAGDTTLHVAAYWNHPDIVGLLVAHGADVGSINRWGDTPLHVGAVSGHMDVVQRLLDAGAAPLARTKAGLTAVEIAKRIKNKELARLLAEHNLL
jgi:ankyrin repeat protein